MVTFFFLALLGFSRTNQLYLCFPSDRKHVLLSDFNFLCRKLHMSGQTRELVAYSEFLPNLLTLSSFFPHTPHIEDERSAGMAHVTYRV